MSRISRGFKVYLSILCSLFLFSIAIADTAKDAVKQQVEKTYQDWCTTIGTAKGDGKEVVKFYADDGVLHPTLSDKMLINHDQLTDYFNKLTSYPDINCTPKTMKTRVKSDNIAIISGTYTFSFTDNGKTKKLPARFSFVFKKVGDNWLIADHHSSKMP